MGHHYHTRLKGGSIIKVVRKQQALNNSFAKKLQYNVQN